MRRGRGARWGRRAAVACAAAGASAAQGAAFRRRCAPAMSRPEAVTGSASAGDMALLPPEKRGWALEEGDLG